MLCHRLPLAPPRRPHRATFAALIVAAGLAPASSPARAGADFFAAAPAPKPPAAGSAPAPAAASTPTPDTAAAGRLVLARRAMMQDQGDWQVDYAFRNAGAEPVVLRPADVAARVEGWVSNSRVAAHATPRRAAAEVDGRSSPVAFAEVIAAPDESRRCRERVALWVGVEPPGDAPDPRARPVVSYLGASAAAHRPQPPALATVSVPPGELVRVRLRLEHQHAVHGDYDPLLGRRDLELRLGSAAFRDALPLDREQYLAMPRETWPEPPDEHKDARYAVSGPDSLHLDADQPGGSYFRFPDRRVRYSTRMRLRFWYRVAPGTEGEVHARVTQYRITPGDSYKVLSDGGSDVHLAAAGHWTLFDRVIRTEAEATALALDFRITPCDLGEAWVDDVSLEPADAPPGAP